jgi:hypothetical protein
MDVRTAAINVFEKVDWGFKTPNIKRQTPEIERVKG